MSAVSNITYVQLYDLTPTDPQQGTFVTPFANYNEAMSFAKQTSNRVGRDCVLWIWNYNGGSGYWREGVWYPEPNQNWP